MIGENESNRMAFIRSTITQYQAGEFYTTAALAVEYDKKRNPDIHKFTKLIYTATGRQVPDKYSSDYRIGRAFFPFFVTQENQYLLSNGVTWGNDDTKDKLGKKGSEFDSRLQDAGHAALVSGCAYGFWNLDHLQVFTVQEFIPLYDEENGALRAGIRYWQIDTGKPFRATLYEEDGYTDYIWYRRDVEGSKKEIGEVMHDKRPYKIEITGTAIDEEKIYKGENYPTFPIVPLWGNKRHQSELVGLREQIFAYDMIKSGFCNTVEDASYVFWAIHNAPGMSDDIALAEFMSRVRKLHVAITEDEASTAVPQQLETPYASREALLERMEKDIFKDAMAFDPERVASGASTATQIRAAYENLEIKVNDYEYCIIEFINGILKLAGVDDEPSFTRSKNVNTAEEIQTIVSAGTSLDQEYMTRKILTILGDGDQADEVIARMINDEVTVQRSLDNEDDVNEP